MKIENLDIQRLDNLNQEQMLFVGLSLAENLYYTVKALKKKGVEVSDACNITGRDIGQKLSSLHGISKEEYAKMGSEQFISTMNPVIDKLCSEESWNEINKVLEGTDEMAA